MRISKYSGAIILLGALFAFVLPSPGLLLRPFLDYFLINVRKLSNEDQKLISTTKTNSGFWDWQSAKNVIRRLLPKNILSFIQKPEEKSDTIITVAERNTAIAHKNMCLGVSLRNK